MQTALITGGSKGFGKATAAALGSAGWKVTVTARSESALRQASMLPNVQAIAGNVREEEHRRLLAGAVEDGLDLLVNNASSLGPSPLRRLADTDSVDLHTVFDTNVVSPLALTKLVLPALGRRRGVVVNVSSDAALEVYERWGAYGASKAALDHATLVLAAENPRLSIYAFDPGDMRTDMHQAAFPGEDISDRPLPESVVPILLRLVEARPPSGRYSAADLLAGAE